ncbi:MAG: DUF739 family protein [Vallitaleaceae bacterium]|nr:DUF739 family protein [Vallitaleaceae bacterium]
MPYNYSKLLGRITEKYGSQSKFSTAMGLSERSLSLKLNGRVGFKQNEIAKACSLLNLTDTDIPNYFFTLKVQ